MFVFNSLVCILANLTRKHSMAILLPFAMCISFKITLILHNARTIVLLKTAAGLAKERLNTREICQTMKAIVFNQSNCSILAHLGAAARAVTYRFRANLAADGRQRLLLFIN